LSRWSAEAPTPCQGVERTVTGTIAVAAAPNVMEFLPKAGRRQAEQATVFLERKIAEARQ
jgi:hypothetical protein